jgi:hypothetical protein
LTRLIGYVVVAMAAFLGGYLLARREAAAEAPAAVVASTDSTPLHDSTAAPDSARADSAAVAAATATPVIAGGTSPRLPSTLLDSASVNVDGDSVPERVELYAEVQRDRAGRITWDDGQRWLLVVRKGEETFTLLDERVQLGTVGFTAVEHASGDQGAIVVETQAGAGVRVRSYVFDRAAGGFVSRDSVSASGIVVHRPRLTY